MRIPSFDIRNQRSIRQASCDRVPRLMIVAGPNGAGKSTVLNQLRTIAGSEHVVYAGPHRSTRRQRVMERHLRAATIDFEMILSSASVPGYEGIQLLGGTRDPWGYDDSGNYLKHALCQVDIERQHAIAARLDREGEILRDTLPDPWEPLRDVISDLLPHLSFQGIDTSNRDQVLCLWSVHGREDGVDFDELSSGEKSVIQMLYPLVERQIKDRVAQIRGAFEPSAVAETCFLIDEPELHLHPNLQLKVIDYLRVLTSGTHTQVIIATHSPTIVEYASFEELFLLRPPELVEEGENQLVRVADDDGRLATLRALFGSTTNLTALQPVLVVEGTDEQSARRTMPDRKLYRALHPGFDGITLIPGGGRSECIRLAQGLSEALRGFSTRLTAFALIDRDLAEGAEPENVVFLPVSMIENFLLDPDAIYEAVQSVAEQAGLNSVDDVETALDAILDDFEEEEIARRALNTLGTRFFRPSAPLTDVPRQLTEFTTALADGFSANKITTSETAARTIIQRLAEERRRREDYHGKRVMEEFYRRHLAQTPLAKTVFAFEAARHARRRASVVTYFDQLFARFGDGLPTTAA